MTPQEQLAEFIRTARAAGGTDDTVRASLKSAGWAEPDVEAAFSALSVPTALASTVSDTPKMAKAFPKLPWKWIVIGAGALLVIAGGVFVFLFVTKKTPEAVTPATNVPKTVSNQPKPLPPKEGIAVGEPNPNGETNSNGNINTGANANTGTVSVAGKDDSSLNDSDLSPMAVNVPLEQNAYVDPEKVRDYAGWDNSWARFLASYEDFPKNWNNATAKDILDKNKSAISGFLVVAQRPKYQDQKYSDPKVHNSNDAPNDIYPAMMTLIQLDAFYRAKNGNAAAGRQEALLLASYGQKMALSLFNADGYKNALDMKSAGLGSLKQLISLFPPTATEAKELDTQLAALGDTATGLAEDLRFEYVVGKKELLAGIAAGELSNLVGADNAKNPFLFEQNKTLNLIADSMRSLIKTTSVTCLPNAEVEPRAGLSDDESDVLRKMNTENAIGQIIVTSLPDYSPELNYRCKDVANINGIRASLQVMAGGK